MATAAAVKAEPGAPAVDPIDLEERIVQLLTESPDGLTNKEIMSHTAGVELAQRMAAINRLLSANRVEMRRVTGGAANDFLLKLKAPSASTGLSGTAAATMEGASAEETLVYQIVEEAGRLGIWVRDVRARSGLSQALLARVLKSLESRKLVKSVKAVGANRKKLLRSRAERAAAMHKGDVLAQKQASVVSAAEVCQHIRDMKISRVELTVPDIERVLDTVVYDGCAERVASAGAKATAGYRHTLRWQPSGALASSAPCPHCPLAADCAPSGAVSPATCAYFNDWLADAAGLAGGKVDEGAIDVKPKV